MKTRASRTAFFIAIGVVVSAFVALPQAAQAQSTDIAVLHSKVDNIYSILDRMDDKFTKRLDRMDGRLDRMDASIVEIKENGARTDEKVNALQAQNNFFVIPLLLLLVAAMFGLLTKGVLWGVDRPPKASSGVSPRLGVAP